MKKWLMTLSMATAMVSSVAVAGGDAAAGEAKSAMCAGCHMADGNSVNGMWPKLAGQHESYIIKQLQDFKAGDRIDPTMQPMAAGLSEDDMANLAAFYNSQTLKVGEADPALVEKGKLRRGLIAQLSVLALKVPPLRDYSEDVPELLAYYVDKLVDAERLTFRRFSVAAQNRLRNYPWPDNVRELKNLVRRLLLTGSEGDISLDEVENEISSGAPANEPLVKQDLLSLPLREAREQFERAYLQQQLVLCDGKVGQLAKRVGMERTHLYRKLRSLGVDFKSVGTDD